MAQEKNVCPINERKEKKKFLFSAIDGVGHINAIIAIADYLKNSGHEITFLLPRQFDIPGHKVVSLETILRQQLIDNNEKKEDLSAEEAQKEDFIRFSQSFRLDPVNIKEILYGKEFPKMFGKLAKLFPIMKSYLQQNPPDVIICDYLCTIPPLMSDNCCWISVHSWTPLDVWHYYYPDRVPPAFLGLPTKSSKEILEKYHEIDMKIRQPVIEIVKKFCHEYETEPNVTGEQIIESPWLNIYTYPRILDYDRVCDGLQLPKNWLRCDQLIRSHDNTKQQFKIPDQLKLLPGKLIFLSMGTLASMDLSVMRRLVDILGKLPHKFIVSKGACHDQYELPSNMWGDRYVPQLAILPQIDLIITHGGNNTITECLYYGVPGLIVLPVFGDQFDNAQRVEEEKLGVRLNAFKSTAEEFSEAIERLLNDNELKQRMNTISKELQSSDDVNNVAKRIQQLAYQPIRTK